MTPPVHTVVAVCPLCGREPGEEHARGPDFEYASTGDAEWSFRRCATCDIVSLSPRPDDSEIRRIYPPHYYAYDFSQTRSVGYLAKALLDRRAAKVYLDAATADGDVLDVGCGDGRLLQIFRDRGVPAERLFGVELDEKAVAVARGRGFGVHHGRFEDSAFPAERFRLIVLQQVIEHVPDPRGMIEKIRGLLRPGGAVVIETPNTASWDHSLFARRYWGGYHIPRHFHLFNPRSLTRLLEVTGLEVTRVTSLASPNFWIQSLHHVGVDRGWPKAWARFFRPHPPGPIPLAVFSALDAAGKLARMTSNMRVIAVRREE
jgi:2-polyprenyl-3-methyl-5-hydroxy-6-metoxy-1,4-benzoquinol methylase